MSTTELTVGPVVAQPEEVPQIQTLNKALSSRAPGSGTRYYLADSNGERIELPASIFRVLASVAQQMALGRSVTILHYDHELTTQEAADILQVSRPFLIRLIEQGHIPYRMVGSHRRIRMGDLMDYKSSRDSRRRESLKELQRVSETLGLYEDEGPRS